MRDCTVLATIVHLNVRRNAYPHSGVILVDVGYERNLRPAVCEPW